MAIRKLSNSGIKTTGTVKYDNMGANILPATPTIGTATDVGTARAYNNGAATVTFTPATTGGTATSYTALSSPGGFTATGSASPLTVTGLQSGVAYTFTVRANNSNGSSAYSTASNSITATTVPQAPTIGTATAGDASASITFTANATGGKTITSYTATSSPGSLTGSAASSPITVSGLTNDTTYTFTVTATNANGTSAASAASNNATPTAPGSYDSIATVVGTGSNTTITFSSIPNTYKHLILRYNVLGATSSGSNWRLTFNGNVTVGTYMWAYMMGTGSSVSAGVNFSSQNNILIGGVGSGLDATYPNVGQLTILDYANTSKATTVLGYVGTDRNGSGDIALLNETWNLTTAVNSITITLGGSAFASTTSFALYGIKAA